ncbi:MAG TPA: DNA mismatch repair protein MutS [bacterium]|nr:DNA mismatch repair protein MutS [bacterium]
MNKITPMLKQYFEIKEQYPDCILFFRMGDFYEMFYDDAVKASKALEITLTTRNHGMPEAVPLCGVPYHAADTYLARLVDAGFKVAVCEQVEDPKKAKGLVRRAVTRVITPGTSLAPGHLSAKEPRYLAAVAVNDTGLGLAFIDYSTGEFKATEPMGVAELVDELGRLSPAEVLIAREGLDHAALGPAIKEFAARSEPACPLAHPPEGAFDEAGARKTLLHHFGAETLEGFGVEGFPLAISAAGALLYYLEETQEPEEAPAFEISGDEPITIPRPLSHITSLSYYTTADYMILDEVSKRNLELTRTLRDQKSKGSLFWLIDMTATPMGGRALLSWLHYPLLDPAAINERLDAVEYSLENHAFRLDLRDLMEHVTDLERLTARVSFGSAHARDLAAVRETLKLVPKIKGVLAHGESALLQEIHGRLDAQEELVTLLDRALVDDPPFSLREGGIIRSGYSTEIDELTALMRDAKSVIARMEATERQRTGIASLKVKYNQVFGYYIEVTKANLRLAPADYIRKQTLVNAERFITPELKDLETKILGAEERLTELHYELFCELRDRVAARGAKLAETARELGRLDAVLGLAELASRKRFTRPQVDGEDRIEIKGGWHPVIAELVKSERFVPNDVRLDNDDHQILIITGPNMAGKSTVLRQTALIVILAQMGSFVPAEEAAIGVADRIFTRVGASDVLVRGMSTFMVEMTETANILHHATNKSLVLLDEIGRGTSTFDGLSIAWAVAEFLHDTPGHQAKTMFATHYHELVDLTETRERIKNYHILVKEWEGNVIFLRKMAPGSTSRSYGIQVARLAGLPSPVIERAKEILANLEAVEHDPAGRPVIGKSAKGAHNKVGSAQLNFFTRPADPAADDIVSRVKALDPQSLTPLEALTILDELKSRLLKK